MWPEVVKRACGVDGVTARDRGEAVACHRYSRASSGRWSPTFWSRACSPRLTPCVALSFSRLVRIAHFEIQGLLGQGGSGLVYKACDTRVQRLVALKLLHHATESAALAALREARVTARLQHRAFVTIFEVGSFEGKPFVVMELVDGETLGAIAARGAVPTEQLREWAIQAAQALGAAHKMGVVHGDVKPSNLMIDGAGQVRILDLGIAQLADPQMTQPNLVGAGTFAYAAPEVLTGETPNVVSDVFSLGLTLYEASIGRRLTKSGNRFIDAHDRLVAQVPLEHAPSSVQAEDLFLVMQAMTRRDPASRPQSMDEVVNAFRDAHASKRSGAIGAVPPGHNARTRAWAIGFALLLAIAASATWQMTRTTAPTAAQLADAEALLRRPDDRAAIQQAIALFEREIAARKTASPRSKALLAIAYCLQYAGNQRDKTWLQRADAASQLALRAEDQLALAQVARAWVLELQRKLPEASAAYERALLLDPFEFHALNGQAQLLLGTRNTERAIEVFRKALETYPNEPTFLNGLGAAFFELGDSRQAEALFRQSLVAAPWSAVTYANLNAVLTKQGRLDEALTVLQQGLVAGPDSRLYGNLGNTLFVLGRYVEAVDAFERAVSAERGSPNDYRNWANLADAQRMVPGRQADALKSYRRALTLLAPLMESAPSPQLLSRAGLYAAKAGDFKAAQKWTRQAGSNAAVDSAILLRATVVHELMGDRDKAISTIALALAQGYPIRSVEDEPELRDLRRDQRFHLLLVNPLKSP